MDIEECAAYFRSVMKTALHKFLHNCSNFNLCCVSTSVILVQCFDSVSILCSVLTAFRDLVHTTAKVQNLCPRVQDISFGVSRTVGYSPEDTTPVQCIYKCLLKRPKTA